MRVPCGGRALFALFSLPADDRAVAHGHVESLLRGDQPVKHRDGLQRQLHDRGAVGSVDGAEHAAFAAAECVGGFLQFRGPFVGVGGLCCQQFACLGRVDLRWPGHEEDIAGQDHAERMKRHVLSPSIDDVSVEPAFALGRLDLRCLAGRHQCRFPDPLVPVLVSVHSIVIADHDAAGRDKADGVSNSRAAAEHVLSVHPVAQFPPRIVEESD